MKGWRPVLDSDGNAIQFQLELFQQLVVMGTAKPEILEQALYNAGTAPNVSKTSRDRTKPWDTHEMQGLLKQRRECVTAAERRDLSKTIQKVSRRLIRRHNDAKIGEILREFADLRRLDAISEFSKPTKQCTEKIDSQEFVALFQKVYASEDLELRVDKEKPVAFHFSRWLN